MKPIDMKSIDYNYIFLIDADMLAFRAAVAVEQEIDWGDGLWLNYSELSDAKGVFIDSLNDILDKLKNDHGMKPATLLFCFSDLNGHNFRKDLVDSTYKSNRKDKRKPLCYRALVDYIKNNYITVSLPNLEGDDVIGIHATRILFNEEDQLKSNIPVIISGDKDFKSIPGKFYNFIEDKLYDISLEDAERFHVYQTLVGDTADGYKGCPSYGDKKATHLLETTFFNKLWSETIKAFEKVGLSKEDCLTQARLSHILWNTDYDFKTGKIKLWEFPEYIE